MTTPLHLPCVLVLHTCAVKADAVYSHARTHLRSVAHHEQTDEAGETAVFKAIAQCQHDTIAALLDAMPLEACRAVDGRGRTIVQAASEAGLTGPALKAVSDATKTEEERESEAEAARQAETARDAAYKAAAATKLQSIQRGKSSRSIARKKRKKGSTKSPKGKSSSPGKRRKKSSKSKSPKGKKKR